jgi:hypothetical protein
MNSGGLDLNRVDPAQREAPKRDYVNETRGFVMELHFPSGRGCAKLLS